MRALGLWQPYGGLIAIGVKQIETRFWHCRPGLVLICSTQTQAKVNDPVWDLLTGQISMSSQLLTFVLDNTESCYVRGAMLCVANIIECRLGTIDDEQKACAPLFVDGRQKYAFILSDVRPVKHKPVRCGQKWFNVPDDEIEY